MDFFTLLQATGFVRKEHSKDLKPTSVAEILARSKDIGPDGKKLTKIPELDDESKPWKIKRTKKAPTDAESSSDSDQPVRNFWIKFNHFYFWILQVFH